MARTKTSARQTLLDSATVLLAENPGASFIEIAEAAGVGRASLYRHFPTRDDLVRELCLEALKTMDEAVSHIYWTAKSSAEALEMTINAMVPLGDRLYFLTRIGEVTDKQVTKEMTRQNKDMLQLIEGAQKEGVLDATVTPRWINGVFTGLICTAWDAMAQDQVSANEAASLVSRSLLKGLSPLPQDTLS
ncbi:TetR/AcrR family transcriptional regulator [Pontibacterium sp. N1Y112]|uniref:TetR/AcrR family transcriptional regulator n=1 Tax=Pontibacterium sinense TaxID=2781979 RepID=A0A8J7KBA3_9GAMM|nr:TetR/AcrR family transcriptional regulator [Pontibacterium sinense]MBE9398941.1 TetR/AcrR family transcriptional regulator [Pontibacterium sinense]